MSTHAHKQKEETDMTPVLNFISATCLTISILFRAVAREAANVAQLYNILACISVLMIIVINYPKFMARVKKIYKNYVSKRPKKRQ